MTRRVLFRVDASALSGAGHLVRCLALAEALRARGCDSTFACASLPASLRELVDAAGHRLVEIRPVPETVKGARLDGEVLSASAQREDAKETVAAVHGHFDWVVLDDYRFNRSWTDAARGAGRRVLVVDDLANREHECDVLVDQTLGRTRADYENLVPYGCLVLLGPGHAMLRAEFAAARRAAFARLRDGRMTGRLLVSMGATDVGGITLAVVEALLAKGLSSQLDVVVGAEAPSLPGLESLARRPQQVSLHINTTNMATLMVGVDVAIGAAGTSSWERCCMALPAVMLVLADNQRLVAQRLADSCAAAVVDDPAAAAAAAVMLLEDGGARASMAAAAAAVVDGEGAGSVAEAMIGSPRHRSSAPAYFVRPATHRDSEMIWLWRNDPLTRSMAKTRDPIRWTDHAAWFQVTTASGRSTLYVVEVDTAPAAMVRFDLSGSAAEVSINVDPRMRGRGIGQGALAAACDRYGQDRAPAALRADIRSSNHASQKIFHAAGFEPVGGEGDFLTFVRPSELAVTRRPGESERLA